MDFRDQIKEDIEEYQEKYPNIKNINKDEWAFNFWILDKFFQIDEELIESNIVDYKDLGIDCFVYYEDTKEFYLIQNKYYSDSTQLTRSYVEDDFLIRPYNALKEGTYRKNSDLQRAFTKYKNDSDFYVYLQIYVTNDLISDDVVESIRKFNQNHASNHIKAELYMLKDIQNKYYDNPIENKINFEYTINTINNGTILKVDSENYPFDLPLKARYILTPVVTIYRMYRAAKEKQYPIFDANIREYLGNKGINKNMYNTLMSQEDRSNFFYYNNGITVVCNNMSTPKTTPNGLKFSVSNPQIVNGCQTVSTIYEALDTYDPSSLEKEFKNTFVLIKLLQIDDSIEQEVLYKSIVKYNNSQNAIDEKTFVANHSVFLRLQKEFEKKGFLLLIKQSDKNTFLNKYKTQTELLNRNSELLEKYGIELKKVADFTIKLDKLLQIILAFVNGGTEAYQKKSNLLKVGTDQYNTVMNFIKDNNVTINAILNLYLLYLKMNLQKKDSEYGTFPIAYYGIDCFNRFNCEGDYTKILNNLNSKENIEKLYNIYYSATLQYTIGYTREKGTSYNNMIKQNIEYDRLLDCYKYAKAMSEIPKSF